MSVIFGGRYVTNWKEDGITWGNCSLFYEEVVHVVAQRKIGEKASLICCLEKSIATAWINTFCVRDGFVYAFAYAELTHTHFMLTIY